MKRSTPQTDRNLTPHAEARLAIAMWGNEYASQTGGSMDFWDSLGESRQKLCVSILDGILEAQRLYGRSALSSGGDEK